MAFDRIEDKIILAGTAKYTHSLALRGQLSNLCDLQLPRVHLN